MEIKHKSNNNKTKIITLKIYKDPQKHLHNNQIIQWKRKDDFVKYLEVFLDEKLTQYPQYGFYINKKITQGYARMKILYPLVNFESILQI